MNPTAIALAVGLLVGAAGAWYVEAIRWDNAVAAMRHDADVAIAADVEAVNAQLVASRAQTEQIRQVFLDYKTGKEDETSKLESAVADKSKRLRVKATCSPAVPTTGTNASGAASGTAELDADSRQDYYALRRGLDQQYGLLQFCRSELKKRSK